MTTQTKAARVSFPVYRIEHDDFDGRLRVRLSFRPHPETITRLRDGLTGLITGDVMDGGVAGTITAPAGSRLVEMVPEEMGPGLELPGGTILDAEDAVSAARSPDREYSHGLGWSLAINEI